jgi:hypothetical protein
MADTRAGSFVPDEIIQPVRPRQVWATWLGAILLVMLCNFLVAPRLLVGGRNLAGWIIGHKWRLLQQQDAPVDDLVLGDSSCNQGVNPAVLAEELGDRRALNLCTIGDMLALNDAWLLQAYIERFGAPRRVILVHVYDIWGRDFDWTRVGSIPVGFPALRRLQPEVRLQRWQLRSYLESRYFPLYSSNLSLQTRLRPGDPRTRHTPGPRLPDSLGFLGDTVAFPDSVERDLQSHLRFLAGEPLRLSPDNARALERIAHLAAEHDFTVYLAAAPVYRGLAGSPAFQAWFARVQNALATAGGEGARIHLLFDPPMTFPASQMQNADHLVLEAANRYTRALASRIREIEAGRVPPARGSAPPGR